jgi:hypothetical protein
MRYQEAEQSFEFVPLMEKFYGVGPLIAIGCDTKRISV